MADYAENQNIASAKRTNVRANVTTIGNCDRWIRGPDVAKRNPASKTKGIADCASLHPRYDDRNMR